MMMHEGPAEMTGGFFLRRSGAIPAREQPARRNSVLRPCENRENIDPSTGRVFGSNRQRRSPLPEWYPRVPLQDITALLQAIERRDQRRPATPIAPIAPVPIHTPEPVTIITNSPTAPPVDLTPEQEEQEKKLSESLKKIEKMVTKNLRDLKVKKNKKNEVRSNKVLMSMR